MSGVTRTSLRTRSATASAGDVGPDVWVEQAHRVAHAISAGRKTPRVCVRSAGEGGKPRASLTSTLRGWCARARWKKPGRPVALAVDEIRRSSATRTPSCPPTNYQVPEVQVIADTVGDFFRAGGARPRREGTSGGLLRRRFMAEGCTTLAPDVPVYLPNQEALCSLAEMDADDLEERQEFLRSLGRQVSRP